ncbi:MAG: YlbL family protein [Acidimicrobiia bacterium]
MDPTYLPPTDTPEPSDELARTDTAPAGRAPERTRPKRRLLAIVAAVVAGLVVVAAVGAAFVRLPYVLISPGSASRVDDAVEIEGARTYEHDGSVLFVTVSVSDQRPNAYVVLGGWLDGDVDVLPEEDVFGDNSRKEEEQFNQLAMTESQIVATKVSLEKLGYTVPVSSYVVGDIEAGSPAADQLEIDDTITAVDGVPVSMVPDLGEAVRTRAPGEPVTLALTRGDESMTVTVATRATPDGPNEGAAQIGIFSAPEYDFPIEVEIDTGDVGGPSAGLAFTLTILDELSPGDLTGGKEIAVTGTIGSDGTVGAIGGVAQKAVAARRAGARLFIVPKAEAAEARSHADGMKVAAVSDLDDALAALERNGGEPLEEAAA